MSEAQKQQVGWSMQLLKEAEATMAELGSTAVVVVEHDSLIAQWGSPAEKLPVYSVRKSLLSALIGIEVGRGRLNPDSTLTQLGIDDVAPPALSDAEKQATVADLLRARSGVYHLALYETSKRAAERPARGSHPPGTFWYYNNWDFNVLGSIYERAAGVSVFEGFRRDIAIPTGMQDYRPEDGQYVAGAASMHSAYTFRMTARDLARFGLLYMRSGSWEGRQIVPTTWIADSTRAHSITPSGDGYGYMWWTTGADGVASSTDNGWEKAGLPRHSYVAAGNHGQIVAVIPSRHLVVVHLALRSETPRDQADFTKLRAMIRLIVAAAPPR